jgi:hypothetical protein
MPKAHRRVIVRLIGHRYDARTSRVANDVKIADVDALRQDAKLYEKKNCFDRE